MLLLLLLLLLLLKQLCRTSLLGRGLKWGKCRIVFNKSGKQC
jgi:hypothetical protein